MTDTRTHVNDGDEEWIAKYRAALKEAPVQQSYFGKLSAAVRRAHQFVVVRVGKVLKHGKQAQSEKPALSSGLRPSAPSPVVAESPNHVRKPSSGQSTSRRPPRKWRPHQHGRSVPGEENDPTEEEPRILFVLPQEAPRECVKKDIT